MNTSRFWDPTRLDFDAPRGLAVGVASFSFENDLLRLLIDPTAGAAPEAEAAPSTCLLRVV